MWCPSRPVQQLASLGGGGILCCLRDFLTSVAALLLNGAGSARIGGEPTPASAFHDGGTVVARKACNHRVPAPAHIVPHRCSPPLSALWASTARRASPGVKNVATGDSPQ